MAAPTFKVELGFTAGSGWFILDTDLLGTGVLGDDLGFVWTDVSAYVLFDSADLQWSRGASRSQGPWWRYEGGRAGFRLDNLDGRFDPLNLSGPYVTSSVTNCRPGIPCRITATQSSGAELVFVGKVDSWSLPVASPFWSHVDVTCTDLVEALNAANLPAVTEVGAGESGGARVTRILDRVGVSDVERDVDETTLHTMAATTMAAGAWSEIQLTADSDTAYVWVNRNGQLVYRLRTGLSPAPVLSFSSVEADLTAGALEFTALELSYDREQVVNAFGLARAGGVEQYVENLTSQAISDVRAHRRSDLVCETDDQAQDVALWLLSQFENLQVRVESFVVEPTVETSSATWLQLLRLEIGDAVRVTHQTPDGRTITRDGIVRGVAWSVGASSNDDRSFRLNVSMQSKTTVYSPFVLDSVIDGVLDSDTLSV